MKIFSKIVRMHVLEVFLWLTALIFLLFIDPYTQGHHSLCLFKNLGIDFCPGCGLGRSIAMLFQGDLAGSVQMHPLGIPALAIILARVGKLIRDSYKRSYIKIGGQNG